MKPASLSVLSWMILAGACVSGLAVPDVAHAQSSEARRLIANMKSLAEKNAWTGVERNYDGLMDLGEPVPADIHMLGAQSAATQGKALEWLERLERAYAVEADPAVKQSIDAIKSQYGRVRIKGKPAWHPELQIQMMPFAPDQRKSFEYAQETFKGAGSFQGMLPSGAYCFGAQAFEIQAGTDDWVDLKVSSKDLGACTAWGGDAPVAAVTPTVDPTAPKDPKAPKAPKPVRPEGADTGLIYKGPIAVLGGGFMSSGQPAGDLNSPSQIGSLAAGGLKLEVGAELGLTYAFGVGATLGYNSLNGGGSPAALTDYVHANGTIHDTSATLLGVFRTKVGPGDVRVTFGPSLGYLAGKGTGAASFSDYEQIDVLPVEQVAFHGHAVAFGGALSAGYAFVDLNSLQGVVELAGSYKQDDARGWFSTGVRVGIVPKVPRYEGD